MLVYARQSVLLSRNIKAQAFLHSFVCNHLPKKKPLYVHNKESPYQSKDNRGGNGDLVTKTSPFTQDFNHHEFTTQ